ncbi:S-adenosylmethionine decarboxylase [Paraflavisolibacter sp. H34]|uniref:S-adenosylmethionine decarboxylase family protein n=1 Tax=Huijunlia imazamoxiresistens TaxID=3127457 RepID=UPI0030166D3F
MSYQPGIHLIATLQTEQTHLLEQYDALRPWINEQISEHRLQKLGDVYHNFTPAGFTAVICLSESHLSVHTWPEHGRINMDIYLSNFLQNNDGKVHRLYQAFQQFFGASVVNEQFIRR